MPETTAPYAPSARLETESDGDHRVLTIDLGPAGTIALDLNGVAAFNDLVEAIAARGGEVTVDSDTWLIYRAHPDYTATIQVSGQPLSALVHLSLEAHNELLTTTKAALLEDTPR